MTEVDPGVEIIYGPFKPPHMDAPIDQDTSIVFHQWVHGKSCSSLTLHLQTTPANSTATISNPTTPANPTTTNPTTTPKNPTTTPKNPTTTALSSPIVQDTPLNTPVLKRSSPSIYIHSKTNHTDDNQYATTSSGYYTDITEDMPDDIKVSCKRENPVDPPKPPVGSLNPPACPLNPPVGSLDSPVDLGVIDLNTVYEEMKHRQQGNGVFKLQRPNIQNLKMKVMNYRNKIAQRLPRNLHTSPTRQPSTLQPSTRQPPMHHTSGNVTRLSSHTSRLSCQSPIVNRTQVTRNIPQSPIDRDSEKKDRRFTFLQLDGKSNGQLMHEFVNLINCGSAANVEYTNYWHEGILVPTVFDYLSIVPFNVSYPSRKEDRDLLKLQLWHRTHKHVTQENIRFLRSIIFEQPTDFNF